MKLPAVWIVAAFAAGIGAATFYPARPGVCIGVAAAAIFLGGILLWQNFLRAAGVAALLAWAALGAASLAIERGSLPQNHVTRLLAAGRLGTTQPLRWRGRLREDPLLMPWGRRYEIGVEAVEVAGAWQSARGGLRASLYGGAQVAGAPEALRAGDRVEALLRARPPRNFLNPGAFDLHGYLALQRIDLAGSLRSGELLQLVDRPPPTLAQRIARARGNLLSRVDALFPGNPERAAVVRAMLLGDRSFVESTVVTAFQKTSVYHVLVVAGLHVGALAVFFFWLGERLRLPLAARSLLTIFALGAYLGIVQDRPPILRAALMVALYLCARPLFRRVDTANIVALAALVILFWRPGSLRDPSFQLSFLAAGVIAALAIPWMDRTTALYRSALRHLGDVTRDLAHPVKVIHFRIEARAVGQWLAARSPRRLAPYANQFVAAPIRMGLRLWEIVLLSLVIQWGMTPLLALDFHRVSFAGPVANIPAVILTGVIVPLGFLTLCATFLWTRLAALLAGALGFCAGLLLKIVNWFSGIPRISYRIPDPPAWLVVAFLLALVLLAAAARTARNRVANPPAKLLPPARIRPAEWIPAVSLAVLTILIAAHPFPPGLDRGRLEVTVLDVGQGDSIFVAFPDGRTLLIDGGGQPGSETNGIYRASLDIGEAVVSPYLWTRGLKRLDVVALTHAHHDHLDGLRSVLQNFRVRELWVGRDEETRSFESFLAEARSLGVAIVHKHQGERFEWAGVSGEFLWPVDTTPVPAASNDDSLVLKLTDNAVRFLLPGDIQKKAEEELAAEHAPLAADFLKVPHHGSKTSSTEAFLAAVAPHFAVISAGEANPFGHPAQPTLDRYAQWGVRLYRTDRDGAVRALTDGRSLSVHAYLEKLPPILEAQ
ncbi:MAG TPA: ComEC/Rec2 family competence protein [Candidatus Limnocylindrales bacterium]|nr:ComEC/Rec2 family competence protein [Candidatus Limnocylindrales bacterium]